MPRYNYVTCARAEDVIPITPKKVVIIEGILIMTSAELRKRLDIKLFVATDSDERLMRIINRDIIKRGRSYDDVILHYQKYHHVLL